MTPPRALDHVISLHEDLASGEALYRALGFSPTPVTHHPMGTGNQLIIFQSTFIELLAVTNPDRMNAMGRRLTTDLLAERPGLSSIAFTSTDQPADLEAFRTAGVPEVLGFSFQRPITLPDGRPAEADVSVALTHNPATPLLFFFTSHQKKPEAIWQPAWQVHDNGVQDIVEAIIVADAPKADLSAYLGAFLPLEETADGIAGVAAHGYRITVMTPSAFTERFSAAGIRAEAKRPYVAALVLITDRLAALQTALPANALAPDGDGLLVLPSATGGALLSFRPLAYHPSQSTRA